MSDSDKLRETQVNQCNILNKEARKQENPVRKVTYGIYAFLCKKYPGLDFDVTKKLMKTEIAAKLNSQNKEFGTYVANKNSNVSPDGMFLWVNNDERRLILTSEAKHQGTNDKRAEEGKRKQSMGNACERAPKNVDEIKNYTVDCEIFPFSIFFSGCDFEAGSSMIDRVSSLNLTSELNRIYLHDLDGKKRASLFIRPERWTYDEVFRINLEIAEGALEYWLKKFNARL